MEVRRCSGGVEVRCGVSRGGGVEMRCVEVRCGEGR